MRQDQGRYWWELRACAYYAELQKPKIIWPDIARNCRFTIDRSGSYPDMTLFAVPVDDLYLLATLNSHLISWFLRKTSSSIQNDFIRFKRIYLYQLPIPTPTHAQRATIEAVVRSLLDLRGQGPEVAGLEAELNALVYGVYGLTAGEIALIEQSPG